MDGYQGGKGMGGMNWKTGTDIYTLLCIKWASLVAQVVKKLCAMQETLVQFLGQEDPLEKGIRLRTPVFMGLPDGSDGKESTCNGRDLSLIAGWGRSPGGGHATHSSILAWGLPMDRGAWWATVHAVARSRTQLSD